MYNQTIIGSSSEDPLGAVLVRLIESIGVALAAIGVLLNAIICFTLIRIPNFIAPNPCIITISQTVCDGLSCLITLIYTYTSQYATTLGGRNTFAEFVCYIWFSTWIMWAEFGCSIWNNNILTVERYVAICYVFSKWFTRRRVIILCVLCQIVQLAIFLQLPLLQAQLTEAGACIFVPQTSYLRAWGPISMIVYYLAPVFITVALYSHMAVHIYRQSRALTSARKETSKLPKSTVRLAKIAVTITVLHTVTTAPDVFLFSIFYCLLDSYIMLSTSWSYSFILLLYQLIAVGNPMIISFGYPKFWSAFRKALKGKTTFNRNANDI